MPDVPPLDVTRELASRRPAFVAFVIGRVRDRALAEDLVQAAYEHALPRLESVRDESAVVAWFYRSLRNAIISHRRHGQAESRALDELAREVDDRLELEAAPPRVCECVLSVARALKPEYADALDRIEVDGARVKDFAAERGLSNSNAAVRVFRAREALRRGLLHACGACATSGCSDCTCAEPTASS